MGSQSGPIFIGGSPTAGKSFVAEQLSKMLGLEVLVIDEYRDDVRRLAKQNPSKYPKFFAEVDATAEQFWKHRTPDQVMQHEIDEGHEIWPLVLEKITTGFSGIIEGVSILPSLLHEAFGSKARVVFLADRNLERIRQTVYERGVWGEAHTYADWVKELEVRWLPKHAEYFLKEAARYGYPCIEVGERSAVFPQVVKALGLRP